MVLVPGELPREGRFAFWGAGPGPDKVELVFPGGTYGVRKRQVTATFVPVAEALRSWFPVDLADHGVRRSVAVWAAAATAGVGLVARGRLLPTVPADGADAWRAGPLDAADLAWLRELATGFPAVAHALAVRGSRPMRLRSPESLIRDLWDAIADVLSRTAAAPFAVTSPAFAAAGPTRVSDLAEWLGGRCGRARGRGAAWGYAWRPLATTPLDQPNDLGERGGLGQLNVDLADEAQDDVPGGPHVQMVLQLRSTAEETLIVDAADLWDQPERVLARFGPQAEADLLLALRRGAVVWPPLVRVLEQSRPDSPQPGRWRYQRSSGRCY